jgi:hypothetical protein
MEALKASVQMTESQKTKTGHEEKSCCRGKRAKTRSLIVTDELGHIGAMDPIDKQR